MHRLFPERPTMIAGRLVRLCIEEKGVKKWISPEIEDFLASGANFAHSGAAVHQTNLEYLLWIEDKWNKAVETLRSKASSSSDRVCCFMFVYCFVCNFEFVCFLFYFVCF